MRKYASGLGLIGLIMTLVILAFLVLRSYGGSADSAGTSDAQSEEPGAPPADFRSNPNATKHHVEDTFCRSNCESAARNCRAIADGLEARAACDGKLQECATGCK